MRVGLISFHSFFRPGGVKRHVLGLQEEFKKRRQPPHHPPAKGGPLGIHSKIIAPRRNRLEDYGKNVILLGTSFPLSFSGGQSDFNINFNPLAIDRVLKKEKFDVLHFHNFGFPSTFQILASPATSDTLNILTFHANIKGSKFLKRFSLFLKLAERIFQWKIDGIIGVAPLNLEPFKNYEGPKIVIPNGIDLEEFNPQVPKIKKFLNDKINILFVGRIEERKGLIYLLKAYKLLTRKFSNLRLIVVGGGELKGDCQNFVKENNLKEVRFEGQIVGPRLISYYNSCDVFCSPAIFGESFGLVLVEAMACGKPIVAFANEGYREVLKRKGARFLAKPRDYKALAKKLEILIRNEKLREEMGNWGLKEAKKYSWSKIADRVLDFYKLCQKNKEKKEKKSFSIEKVLTKTDEVLNKDIIDWLKSLKFKV